MAKLRASGRPPVDRPSRWRRANMKTVDSCVASTPHAPPLLSLHTGGASHMLVSIRRCCAKRLSGFHVAPQLLHSGTKTCHQLFRPTPLLNVSSGNEPVALQEVRTPTTLRLVVHVGTHFHSLDFNRSTSHSVHRQMSVSNHTSQRWGMFKGSILLAACSCV